jgi:hypothetical protein
MNSLTLLQLFALVGLCAELCAVAGIVALAVWVMLAG